MKEEFRLMQDKGTFESQEEEEGAESLFDSPEKEESIPPPPPAFQRPASMASTSSPAPQPQALASLATRIGSWASQRREMLEAVHDYRKHLLAELKSTEEHLRILGDPLEVDEQPQIDGRIKLNLDVLSKDIEKEEQRELQLTEKYKEMLRPRKAKKPAAKAVASAPKLPDPLKDVLKALSKKPQKISDVQTKTGMAYQDAWRILKSGVKRGLIVESGEPKDKYYARA